MNVTLFGTKTDIEMRAPFQRRKCEPKVNEIHIFLIFILIILLKHQIKLLNMVFVFVHFISSDFCTISHDCFHSIRIDRNDIVHIWTLDHFRTKEIFFSYTDTETRHGFWIMETRKKIDFLFLYILIHV